MRSSRILSSSKINFISVVEENMSDVELTPVREAHKFDAAALESYLNQHVEDFAGPMTIKQFEGGQSNPTFQLITPTRRFVLRKQPPGELLPSAHQVDREYKVMDGLWQTDVPVPKMYCLCEDTSVIGTKFYVMEMVEGRLFNETTMPTESNATRRAVYLDLARVLALLHKVDPAAVGLGEFGRPGNYYERQIGRWSKQYIASQTEDIPAMHSLMEWLPENIPANVGSVIVHGDYRLGNVLIHPTEAKIVAVLDWELSTLARRTRRGTTSTTAQAATRASQRPQRYRTPGIRDARRARRDRPTTRVGHPPKRQPRPPPPPFPTWRISRRWRRRRGWPT